MTGDLVVAPEFVGGQEGEGTVYYDAVIGSKSSPTWDSSNNIHGELASSNSNVSGITARSGNVLKYLTLTSSAMQGFKKEDQTGTIALSLWDSSEVYKFAGDETSGYTTDSTKVDDGTASALDSSDSSGTLYSNFGYQWTIANIPVYFDITDDVAPAGTITPFYWNGEIDSADSDSYNTSENNSIVYYGSTRIGHIDIKTTPDVSGTIKIEGDISDDQIMQSVAVSVGSITTTASYTASSSVWSNGTVSDSDSTEATLGTNGYVLSISDNSLTQNGHSAKWTLLLDTSKLTNGANEISVTTTQNKTASAGSQLSSTPGTTATASGALTGYYPVTVVPYITKIARTNSTIAAGHSDYGNINRSKLGHYPVAEGEELTVYGWNFGTSAKWAVGTSSTDNAVTPTAGDNNLYSFTMTVPSQSGALIVTSGSVNSVNNSNSDNNPSISGNALVNGLSGENGYNAETYAMRGNSTKYWANDDRYFEVWNLGNGFKNTTDGAEFQMPVMTADYSGNLFASWGAASNGQIMFSYGVSGYATPIFNCYDQPAQYTAVAYDKSDKSGNKTGGASVLYMGEQQGLGGTYSGTGLSSSMIIGGAFVTNIPNSYISASTTNTDKTHVVTGNPTMKMDSDNTTGFFNLANYDMTRRLGSYTNPKAARYGNYLHNVWYDSYTESLKYSLIDLSSETVSDWSNRGAAMAGWVVLDGGYTGQDRLHKWSAQSSTNSTNNELSSGGGYHTVTRKAATSTTHQSGITRFTTDIFLGVKEPKLATRSAYISAVTSTSLTMQNVTYATKPKAGDTIALMCNDLGAYTMELRRISSVSGNVISWNGALNTDASKIDTATIYEGDLNVVEGSLDSLATSGSHVKSASSGSSADMALDQNGMPVVAYYDDDSETLRIAKATVVNPELASNWVRTETELSCAGSVSIAVDTSSNIHVVYKNSDSEMCYVFGVVGNDGKYTLYGPEVIDSTTSSDYVSVSVIESDSSKIPCVSYLGSAGTAQSMKYAYRKAAPSSSGTFSDDNWDYMVMPSLGTGHYAISSNPVSAEGRTAGWTSKTESVLTNGGTSATPATVQAAIAFKSKSQFETAYLKTE